MSEADAAERVDEPETVDSPATDFRVFDVERGGIPLVHSSFSSLGWIAGGSQVVVDAFQTMLIDDGTLVMPIHTDQCTDPSVWENPPVLDDWIEVIGGSIPPPRPDMTPIHGMSAVPECFHNYPSAIRSEHPTVFFAAWGVAAEGIIGGHELGYGLSDESPLARVYDRGGDVFLLGVGRGNNTSLHLTEHCMDFERTRTREHAPLLRDGGRIVVEYDDIEVETGNPEAVGEAFERQRSATGGPVVTATTTLLDQSALIGFAEDWFESNR